MRKAIIMMALLWACVGAAFASETNSDNASTDVIVIAEQYESSSSECQCEFQCEYQCECNMCPDQLEFFGPIGIINQHPPTALFLSPTPERATVLDDGENSFSLKLDLTNHLIRENDNGVVADYDFETLRSSIEFQHGTGGGEVSANLPLIYRSHGVLDNIIADWHKWFGLPNGYRDDFPDNQYRYTIISREGLVYNGEGDVLGFGDLSLGYKQNIFDRHSGENALAWRIGLKAPTGNPDNALGSGNWDFSGGLLYQRQFSNRVRGYVNVDYVVIGEPDWNNAGHQDAIVTMWATEYAVNPRTTLNLQFRTHRNPLRTGNTEADKDAQELAMGFNHRLGDGLVWSGGFNEDLNPETAPDFVMMSYLKWEL